MSSTYKAECIYFYVEDKSVTFLQTPRKTGRDLMWEVWPLLMEKEHCNKKTELHLSQSDSLELGGITHGPTLSDHHLLPTS
jgi:hypothetical protein